MVCEFYLDEAGIKKRRRRRTKGKRGLVAAVHRCLWSGERLAGLIQRRGSCASLWLWGLLEATELNGKGCVLGGWAVSDRCSGHTPRGGTWAANRASWEYLMLVTVHFIGLPKPQDGGQEAYNPKEKGHGQGYQNDFILNFLSTWRVPTWNEFNFRKIRIVCMRACMRVAFFKYQSLWLVYSF